MASSAPPRYIPLPTPIPHNDSDWETVYKDIKRSLLASIQQVEAECRAPLASRESVYVGLTGVAMMQYHVAGLNLTLGSKAIPGGVLKPERLRQQADQNLYAVVHQEHLPASVKDGGHTSFLATPIGFATLLLARCIESLAYPRFSEDENMLESLRRHWRAAVSLLLGTIRKVVAEDQDETWIDDDNSEVLFGRAGLLYALLFLRKVIDKSKVDGSFSTLEKSKQDEVERIVKDSNLKRVAGSIMTRGDLGAKRYSKAFKSDSGLEPTPSTLPPLMWRWYGKRYLGAAHGVFGILQMLLSCPESIIESYIPDILFTVEWVIAAQDYEGNWPSKALASLDQRHQALGSNELVQWCHGAPGALTLLSTVLRRGSGPGSLYHLTPEMESQMRGSLKRGADLVYERGVLRKGVGLCHGVGGSVYALLAASSALDSPSDTPYLKKAIHFAHIATLSSELVKMGEMKTPDHAWSLYEGLAGMCCAWSDVLARLVDLKKGVEMTSRMPGYDDIL